jgi:hypothetical protein
MAHLLHYLLKLLGNMQTIDAAHGGGDAATAQDVAT